MHIYSYNNKSASARSLADNLGVRLVKHDAPNLLVTDLLINWGASRIKRAIDFDVILNSPEHVEVAVNKLETFKVLERAKVLTPRFTNSRRDVINWLYEGYTVYARHNLVGNSGDGIEIIDPNDYDLDEEVQIPEAPLYTRGIKITKEFRVHVFNGKAFFIQEKKLRNGLGGVQKLIRNFDNGYIFANQNVVASKEVITQAVKAVKALNLDFGAVDVVTDVIGYGYVLEVNTACGLEGTTLEKYIEQFDLAYEEHII